MGKFVYEDTNLPAHRGRGKTDRNTPVGIRQGFSRPDEADSGSRWTPEERCWHIPYTSAAYAKLRTLFGEGQIEVLKTRPAPHRAKQSAPQTAPTLLRYAEEVNRLEQQLRVQRYSWNTVKTYKNFFVQLLAFYPDRHAISLLTGCSRGKMVGSIAPRAFRRFFEEQLKYRELIPTVRYTH